MNLLKRMISRDWILTTIIVLLGVVLCIRLGIWQLDRLTQRRAFNAHVEEMWAAPPILLPDEIEKFTLDEMEYRAIFARGEYDFDTQVALRNQYWEDQYGYHLLTPFVIGEGVAVIVDRGWIPADENDQPRNWGIYDTTLGIVEISGIVRLGQEKPDVGGRPDPTLEPNQSEMEFWNNANLIRLADQMPYHLLGIYIQLDPLEGSNSPPIPYQPKIELSEGPHLGYAGQWFTFATILLLGYPFFIRRRDI